MAEQALDNHASPDEAADALVQLGTAGLLRLEEIAKNRVRGLNHVEWADLLQEAIARVLAGTRKWPRKVPLVAFMAEVMRSIASEYRNQRDRTTGVGIILEADTLPAWEPESDSVIAAAPAGNPGPDRELEAERKLAALEELFISDEDALAVVMARAEGYTPAEVQLDFGMTPTRYDSTLKRIRRKLNEDDQERTEQ